MAKKQSAIDAIKEILDEVEKTKPASEYRSLLSDAKVEISARLAVESEEIAESDWDASEYDDWDEDDEGDYDSELDSDCYEE
jgi:hypothetical protein